MKIKTWGFAIGVLLLVAGSYTVASSTYKFGEAPLEQASADRTEENSSVPGSSRRDDRRYEKPARRFDFLEASGVGT